MKLIKLECENCGGAIELPETEVKFVGKNKNTILIQSKNVYKCKNCGTEYVNDDTGSEWSNAGSGFSIGNVGGSIIGSTFAAGDIITGNGNTVVKGSNNTVAKLGGISIGGRKVKEIKNGVIYYYE